MKHTTRAWIALLSLALIVALGSCLRGGPTGPLMERKVRLALKQSAKLAAPTVTVTFERVIEESRCPRGVLCFVAGEAVVELSVRDGVRTETLALTLFGEQGDDDSTAPPATAMGHRFQLYRLDPYPQAQDQLHLMRPIVTLRVR